MYAVIISQVGPPAKGASLNVVPFTGEVLDGHYLPGSFAAPVSSPVAVGSLSIADVLASSPAGCHLCGAACGFSVFCSPECEHAYGLILVCEKSAPLDAVAAWEF